MLDSHEPADYDAASSRDRAVRGDHDPSRGLPPVGTIEDGGNCIDEDGDGLAGAEDRDCRTPTTYALDVAKLRGKKAGAANGKLGMKSHVDDPAAPADPHGARRRSLRQRRIHAATNALTLASH